MDNLGFIEHFKELFPRLIIYLAVPFYLGIQFSIVAKEERKAKEGHSAGSYALDAIGLLFAVGVPAFVVSSSIAIFKLGNQYPEVMGGIFRYGLMFLFFGMWWQFFLIMALKAYRDRDKEVNKLHYALFYVGGSLFVSLVAFLGGEWFLKWMSLFLLALASPLLVMSCRRMCRAFLVAAAAAFVLQTAGYIYVSSIV